MPDYSKCPLCGEPLSGYLLNALAQANCNNDACQVACMPMPVAFWHAIHDRLAAVRLEERERCAKMVDEWRVPNLAARIREE